MIILLVRFDRLMSEFLTRQIQINGRPIEHIEPQILRIKLQEPVLLVGKERFAVSSLNYVSSQSQLF